MQIRIHQNAYIASYTRHFEYTIPAALISISDSWQPIGKYDLQSMLADPNFKNAVHELREAQRYYYIWHYRSRILAEEVMQHLGIPSSFAG